MCKWKEKIKPGLSPLPGGLSLADPAMLVATWFGSGLLRPAPGTIGTLAALPFGMGIAYLFGPIGLCVAALALYFAGAWAANRFGKAAGQQDHQSIVVDEAVGLWIAAIPAQTHIELWILAFLLFRFFDIVKPWPASYFDRNKTLNGHGVMLDDVMAGIYALAGVGIVATFFLQP